MKLTLIVTNIVVGFTALFLSSATPTGAPRRPAEARRREGGG